MPSHTTRPMDRVPDPQLVVVRFRIATGGFYRLLTRRVNGGTSAVVVVQLAPCDSVLGAITGRVLSYSLPNEGRGGQGNKRKRIHLVLERPQAMLWVG